MAPTRMTRMGACDAGRRAFLAGLGSSVAGLGLAGCGAPGPTGVTDEAATPQRVREIATWEGGSLAAAPASAIVWPPIATQLWTLGATYPSPTIRARSGEAFSVTLRNGLPEPTNLHWHGLVTPPDMDGHPADVVPPGATRDYTFTVEQRAGTYWYHPHPDRRTGAQVYTGMAGFFIVEDEEERALGLPSGRYDVPLLLQDRRLRPDRSFAYSLTMMDAMTGLLGDTVLVNGTPDATMPVEAAVYRLRLLNGSNARVLRPSFADGRAFLVIATDGGLLEAPVAATSVDLAPGERVELLADFTRDAPGAMVALRSLPFGSGGMGPAPQGIALPILAFEVGGRGPTFTPPAQLARLPRLDPARSRRTRTFTLQMGIGMMAFPTINGRTFDMGRVDERVPVGDVEVWELRNASAEPHPFHVHATLFQVLERSSRAGLAPHDLGWKDTVLLWPGETVRVVLAFERYRGLYVLHCHNLEHEDAGMMLNVEVA